MEIMKKNLRSVTRNSEGRYEYFRLDAEEAIKLVDAKTHIFISKEEYKRQSKFYQDRPCDGTLVNINPFINEEGNKITQRSLNNINWEKLLIKEREFPSSTKIAKCSMQENPVRRRNKYLLRPTNSLRRRNKL